VSDQPNGKTIEDVRRFWSASPLFVGEGSETPGTREWFDEHERIYLQDCLAGDPPAIFTDGLSDDARILDVGCGPGFWVRLFARRGFRGVTGCDLTQAGVDLTARSLEIFRLSGRVDVGNAEALPYAEATFDHVNCQGVLHHTPTPRRAVEEFARVLTPGGSVCLSVYRRNWLLRHPWALRIVARLGGPFVRLRGRGRESLLESGDPDEIVRMYDGRDNPIGRAYTERELRQLMGDLFTIERLERFYFPARTLSIRLPAPLHRWLSRHAGLMIVLRARKCAAR
jgi:SAM-dependent methyltransferase